MPSKINEGLLNNEFARETMGKSKVYAITEAPMSGRILCERAHNGSSEIAI